MSFLLVLTCTLNPAPLLATTEKPATTKQQQITYAQASPVTANKSSSPAIKEEPRKLSMFFKIGIGLNIIMLTLYILWAARQWRQSDKHEE